MSKHDWQPVEGGKQCASCGIVIRTEVTTITLITEDYEEEVYPGEPDMTVLYSSSPFWVGR